MAKKKGARNKIRMIHKETGHCYYTEKNNRNTQDKLKLKKYNPVLRKHVEYEEARKIG